MRRPSSIWREKRRADLHKDATRRSRYAVARMKKEPEMTDLTSISPMLIPIAGIVFGTVMVAAVVGIVFWFKARERELQIHQEMRQREMDHQLKMKQLELEIEKAKGHQTAERVA